MRRIRRDWRDDIVVLASGEDDGEAWVDLGCRSYIACEQARLSLGSFVANPRADWEQWRRDDDEEYPFQLRLLSPRVEAYEPTPA